MLCNSFYAMQCCCTKKKKKAIHTHGLTTFLWSNVISLTASVKLDECKTGIWADTDNELKQSSWPTPLCPFLFVAKQPNSCNGNLQKMLHLNRNGKFQGFIRWIGRIWANLRLLQMLCYCTRFALFSPAVYLCFHSTIGKLRGVYCLKITASLSKEEKMCYRQSDNNPHVHFYQDRMCFTAVFISY